MIDAPDPKSRRIARSAARHFLEGTTHTSPENAVNAGQRSILEWCECLIAAKNDLPFPILKKYKIKTNPVPKPVPTPDTPDTLPLSDEQHAVLEFVHQCGPVRAVAICANLDMLFAAVVNTLQHLRNRRLVDNKRDWEITPRGLERLERETRTESAA